MSLDQRGRMPLDYDLAAYPGSVLRFRGPASAMTRPYVLCLGGSETFGRFIHAPWPAQLAAALDREVLNMGVTNARLDVVLTDPAIGTALRGAAAIVLQVTGAQNMTNRFYSVHPRRNDRFLRASGVLRTIYRDVDFTEFHFTRHLLSHLKTLSPDRFAILRDELQTASRARMTRLIADAAVPVHLLWLANRPPEEEEGLRGLGRDPLFVTRHMLDSVAADAASLTIAVDTATGAPSRGMFYAARKAAAARVLPGPAAHAAAAEALVRHLGRTA